MFHRSCFSRHHTRGVALVIVLAFVVLVTGLIVAFFSRALSERQISNSSANAVRVDVFMQDAVATTLGDLKQEIAAGSVQPFPIPTPGVYLYTPKAPADAVPCLAGAPATLPNLLKRSATSTPFFAGSSYDTTNYPPSNRASAVSSTTASQNGRTISPARWNKTLLLPKKNSASDTDFTPVTTFTPPDWIVVARDGTNPTAWASTLAAGSANPGIGRYAYNIYDEGGLLDMNAAGYPKDNAVTPPQLNYPAYKSSLAFADLAQLPGFSDLVSAAHSTEQIVRTLVGWRNFASTAIDLTQKTPAAGTPVSGNVNIIPGYNWSSNGASGNVFNYLNFVQMNRTGFMHTANPLVVSSQSDHSFASRQQLMNLLLNSIADQTPNGTAERAALQNALQYLCTFTRSINQPSYVPVSRVSNAQTNPNPRPTILPSYNINDPTKGGGNNVGDGYPAAVNQDSFSPNFLTLRAQGVYKRNDGTTDTTVGEPLVKTRFALQRLAWLTYRGPSSTRTIPTSNPGVDSADYDMWQLVNNYGISRDYLTTQGTPEHIKSYFGLEWDNTKHLWNYDLHNSNGAAAGTTPKATGVIRHLDDLAALKTREPDFFELLKASVDPGSIGKASVLSATADLTEGNTNGAGNPLAPLNFQFNRDISLDAAIMQLGANIIDQFDADGYPTRIAFDDGSGKPAREFHGIENLPYIYRVRLGALRAREPIPEGYPGKRNAGSLDNDNDGCTPDWHSGPMPAGTTYTAPNPLKDTGVGILLGIPDIWNPHDQNSSMGSPRPGLNTGSFRIIAASASPDVIASNAGYSTVTVGGDVVSATNLGRYKGQSYSPTGNGGGGAVPPGTIPPNTTAPYIAPIPIFSRTPTPDGTGGTAMTGSNGGYNNPQVITSLPLPDLKPPIPATSSILSFAVPNATLFREPTVLAKPDTTSGSGLAMAISNPDIIQLVGDNGNTWTGTGLKGSMGTLVFGGTPITFGTTNPLGEPSNPSAGLNQPYIGIYLGVFPLRWVGTRWSTGPYVKGPTPPQSTTYWAYTDDFPAELGGPTKSITYSLQCQDAFGSWVSYDEKYVNTNTPAQWVSNGLLMDGIVGTSVFVDPRTSRFGAPNEQYRAFSSPYFHAPTSATWLDNTTDVITTERPDIHAGFGPNFRGTYGTAVDWGNWAAAGWHFKNVYAGGVNSMFFETGLFAQNNPAFGSDGLRYTGDSAGGAGAIDAEFYTDPDGVVRRGMGAFVASATGPLGQPLATASTYAGGKASSNSQSASRPKMLNRPFRSVAELGYVFSGTPWKNLDFSTPESGCSELLDVFCVNEIDDANDLVAGMLDLNTRQTPVLTAVLANTCVNDPGPTAATTLLQSTDAAGIAGLLVKRTSVGSTGVPQPLTNLGDIVGKWVGKKTLSGSYTPGLYSAHNIDGSASYDGFSADIGVSTTTTLATANPLVAPIEAQRETAVRALASVGNTRVWNLLIDVVAQTGRYSGSATKLDNFVVEGEQRCWMHVAIDRATGQVVDSKLEIVKE